MRSQAATLHNSFKNRQSGPFDVTVELDAARQAQHLQAQAISRGNSLAPNIAAHFEGAQKICHRALGYIKFPAYLGVRHRRAALRNRLEYRKRTLDRSRITLF